MLLLEHICSVRREKGTMPENPVFVKTVVTSDLAEKIADSYGVTTVNVLTGFKYIGEEIGYLESLGCSERFILGFEESCGYLTSGYVRDKDGVLAAMLICELAAWYKARGSGIYTALENIYKKYGYCKNSLLSYTFEGPCGFSLMKEKMAILRGKIESIGGLTVETVCDYSYGVGKLPPADMLRFCLIGGSSVIVRPSGTEPKLKAYVSANGNTEESADKILAMIKAHLDDFMK
jgi:phosphoglucomutase